MKKAILAIAILLVGAQTSAQTNQINNTGNVGIGTTSPATPLEVIGSSSLKGNVVVDSTIIVRDSIVIDKDAKVGNDLRVDGKGIFELKLRTKKNLVVDKNARIKKDLIMEDYADEIQDFGILFLDEDGRTYPVEKTKLKGYFDGINYGVSQCLQDENGNSVNLAPTWHTHHPNILYTGIGPCENNAMVGINTDEPKGYLHLVGFGNSGTDRMFVIENPDFNNGNGNHVIFQVSGDGLVHAREVKVNLNNWPDYVFEEDYVLMPLSEVEKYIEEHGHLPNVKSAEEIEKDGLNVGETNKMLMEKMEEMTLYMIELEKKVKALEEKLNSNK